MRGVGLVSCLAPRILAPRSCQLPSAPAAAPHKSHHAPRARPAPPPTPETRATGSIAEERQIARNRINLTRMRRNNHQRPRTRSAPAPPPPARAKTPRLRRASRHAPLRGWRPRRQSRCANSDVRPTPAAAPPATTDPPPTPGPTRQSPPWPFPCAGNYRLQAKNRVGQATPDSVARLASQQPGGSTRRQGDTRSPARYTKFKAISGSDGA